MQRLRNQRIPALVPRGNDHDAFSAQHRWQHTFKYVVFGVPSGLMQKDVTELPGTLVQTLTVIQQPHLNLTPSIPIHFPISHPVPQLFCHGVLLCGHQNLLRHSESWRS